MVQCSHSSSTRTGTNLSIWNRWIWVIFTKVNNERTCIHPPYHSRRHCVKWKGRHIQDDDVEMASCKLNHYLGINKKHVQIMKRKYSHPLANVWRPKLRICFGGKNAFKSLNHNWKLSTELISLSIHHGVAKIKSFLFAWRCWIFAQFSFSQQISNGLWLNLKCFALRRLKHEMCGSWKGF